VELIIAAQVRKREERNGGHGRELEESRWCRGEKRLATGIVNGLDGNGTQTWSMRLGTAVRSKMIWRGELENTF